MRISDWSSDVCSSDLVVGGLVDEAQIGQRVTDFGAFVEAATADDAIGQADLDEAVFELAGLVLVADEDGHFVPRSAAAFDRFDLLAHAPRFLRPVPHAHGADLLAPVHVGPHRLAPAT